MSHYSSVTLDGNWFEDRGPPLKGVLADYGHRQYETTASIDLAKGLQATIASKEGRAEKLKLLHSGGGDLSMVQMATINEVLRDRPVVDTSFEGICDEDIGSKQNQEQMVSTCKASFGEGPSRSAMRRAPAQTINSVKSSTQSSPAAPVMHPIGERFATGVDPQNNTASQRSWMYSQDPVVKYHMNGLPTAPADETGLPIGRGPKPKPGPRLRSITQHSEPTAQKGVQIYMDYRS